MINGKSANFDRRLAKLENSKLGVPANLAGFRIPKITVHEGDDVDQIIEDMEARGEIPPLENFPAGQIRVIVHRIISPPNGERNWERYITSGTNLKIAEAQARAIESSVPNKDGGRVTGNRSAGV